MRNTHVPVGPWRGVNTNQNAVYMECFIDEVARAAGADPVEFRRALMQYHPKHLAVLNAVAAKADWGKPLPAGVHRGVAQFMGYGSYSAAVAEVSVSDKGKLKVHRMVLGVNCGHAVNPDQIAAQVEGSVAYGLSATFYGECTVEKGRIAETNFHTYEILRLAEMPKVETVIVPIVRLLGRRRRTDDLCRGARGDERDYRRHGQAGAQPAAQESADGVTAEAVQRMSAQTSGPRHSPSAPQAGSGGARARSGAGAWQVPPSPPILLRPQRCPARRR